MEASYAADPQVLARYEGLVCATAERHVGKVALERDDLRQTFRIRVWRALLSYDARRSKMTEEAYVFSCVVNQAKDLHRGTKYKHRPESYIDDLAPSRDSAGAERAGRDRWEAEHGLAVEADSIFAEVEAEEVPIPNTLSPVEVQVVCLLYADYTQTEITARLSLTKRQMETGMKSIRTKMADFRPDTDEAQIVTLPVPSMAPEAVAA